MNGLESSTAADDLKGNLDVLGEDFGRDELRNPRIRYTHRGTKESRSISHQQRVQIDHGATGWSHCDNRNIQKYLIRK